MKIKIFIKILIGLIIVFFLFWLNLIYRIYKYSFIDETQKANAIIVLGASQWNGKPSPVLKDRLDHALFIYKEKLSNNFILTGGIGENGNMSESQAGKNYLIEKGIAEESIFIEEISKTTWENLNEALKIAHQQNFNSVILASNKFHSFRIKKMANNLEIKNFISSVKNGIIEQNKFINFKYILRESAVYILYKIFKI